MITLATTPAPVSAASERCTGAPVRASASAALGFTLVELIVSVAVAAILTTVAVPSFRDLILTSRLSSSATDLIVAVGTARIEAIKRNASISVCTDSSCAVKTAGSATIRDGVVGITAPLQIQSVQSLVFGGQGLARTPTGTGPYSGLVADIFTASLSANGHRCIYMSTGSVVRSCAITGACPNAEPASCQE
jgi:type IV fimbrial biogenesis protein FimT